MQSEFLTNSYDRGGFFIHGGTEWGSAGCIDIKNGDKKLFKYLVLHSANMGRYIGYILSGSTHAEAAQKATMTFPITNDDDTGE